MKKLLFLAVSLLMTSASYCASAGEKIVSKFTDRDSFIQQQNEQQLILENNIADCDLLADHYSHSSHSSHSSHYSGY